MRGAEARRRWRARLCRLPLREHARVGQRSVRVLRARVRGALLAGGDHLGAPDLERRGAARAHPVAADGARRVRRPDVEAAAVPHARDARGGRGGGRQARGVSEREFILFIYLNGGERLAPQTPPVRNDAAQKDRVAQPLPRAARAIVPRQKSVQPVSARAVVVAYVFAARAGQRKPNGVQVPRDGHVAKGCRGGPSEMVHRTPVVHRPREHAQVTKLRRDERGGRVPRARVRAAAQELQDLHVARIRGAGGHAGRHLDIALAHPAQQLEVVVLRRGHHRAGAHARAVRGRPLDYRAPVAHRRVRYSERVPGAWWARRPLLRLPQPLQHRELPAPRGVLRDRFRPHDVVPVVEVSQHVQVPVASGRPDQCEDVVRAVRVQQPRQQLEVPIARRVLGRGGIPIEPVHLIARPHQRLFAVVPGQPARELGVPLDRAVDAVRPL